jgi:RHS repeat-associated protein
MVPNQLVGERIGSAHYYDLFDSQNTVLGLVNSSGTQIASYSHDPYGQARTATSSVSNPFRYVSGVYDSATGLTKFGARYYDPALGRFTQRDPTHQESNAYSYVGCNPVNASDPNGRLSESQICGLVILGVGLVLAALTATATAGLAAAALVSAVVAAGIAVGSDISLTVALGLFTTFLC